MQLDDQPVTKRRRIRHSVACEACKVRKSRCELVTAAGCHRCSVLRTPCSLTRIGSGSETEYTPRGSFSGPAHDPFANGIPSRGSVSSPSQPRPSVDVAASPGRGSVVLLDRDQIMAAVAEIRDYTARIEVLSQSVMAALSVPVQSSQPGPSKWAAATPSAIAPAQQELQEFVDAAPLETQDSPALNASSQAIPSHTDPAALLHWNCQGSDDVGVTDFTTRTPFSRDIVESALDQ